LFHEERNIIIVDILVVHGRCHGDKLPQISGLKKMSVIQVLPAAASLFSFIQYRRCRRATSC
jgi:hypothetical protein